MHAGIEVMQFLLSEVFEFITRGRYFFESKRELLKNRLLTYPRYSTGVHCERK